MFDPLATIKADGPDYLNVRKAGRAGIVMPGVLAFGMFVVMFGATFATVFGGYRALHVAPIALAYSLSVLMPLDQSDLFVRVAGWRSAGWSP